MAGVTNFPSLPGQRSPSLVVFFHSCRPSAQKTTNPRLPNTQQFQQENVHLHSNELGRGDAGEMGLVVVPVHFALVPTYVTSWSVEFDCRSSSAGALCRCDDARLAIDRWRHGRVLTSGRTCSCRQRSWGVESGDVNVSDLTIIQPSSAHSETNGDISAEGSMQVKIEPKL